ncbi:chorismate synthase [Desulfonatronum thioautotrophicum]|uniref:chorismate synthase n=1 Tax=Desulfonatronum thioautotrophicum TaxID=617001 RepID=UPI0005EB778A|nr:chorismate synthase [Desulfonatronum thioautotrophicum]
MSGNTFGRLFCLTTFGESHGPGLGGVVDGCPAGIALDERMIQRELDRRKPGQGLGTTSRRESDQVRLMSGVFEGKTTGTAIGFFIANEDQRSRDYGPLQRLFRPGHADITYQAKYGIRDYRGGGRSSGRETVCRVVGGAVAQEVLASAGISVCASTVEMGGIGLAAVAGSETLRDRDAALVDAGVPDALDAPNAPEAPDAPDAPQNRPFFAAHPDLVEMWEDRIKAVRSQGDTLGGIVEVRALGLPAGLGEPVLDKLDARLAYALMGVGAVKGVEIGAGFAAARMLGSTNNDPILPQGFASNNSGGVLGGISSGQPLVIRVAVKPIPSIARPQVTVDQDGHEQELRIGGRHDICAIPRIVPVLKAMVCLTLADMLLLHRAAGHWQS